MLPKTFNISISEVEDDGAFSENTKSKTYNITGLPNQFQNRIKVIIKYNSELEEGSYIAIGENFLDPATNEESIFFSLLFIMAVFRICIDS